MIALYAVYSKTTIISFTTIKDIFITVHSNSNGLYRYQCISISITRKAKVIVHVHVSDEGTA